MTLCKSLLLHLYYYGSGPVRWWDRLGWAWDGRCPITVLYYHRVADEAPGPWTCPNRLFVRQMQWLVRRFEMISLAEVQRRIRIGESARPAVHVTFDDGYSENCQEAIPLLVRLRVPCTYFVSAGHVVSGEPFAHDLACGTPRPPNTPEQLRAMAGAGIEIGSHTFTHADLGAALSDAQLRHELAGSKAQIEQIVARPVRYFAFPYGQFRHLSAAAFEHARRAGYEAVCTAFGGYNFPGGDAFHIRRFHVDDDMIRLKNHASIDPRKLHAPSFAYPSIPAENASA